MRYWLSLTGAVLLLAFVIMAGGVAGQTKKSKAKKRRTTQTTVVQKDTLTPVEIPASVPKPAAATPAMQTPEDGVRRITPAEAREALDKGKAIIIDVRGEASYDAGHVKGARLIPVNDIGSRASELPRDKMIITYCS